MDIKEEPCILLPNYNFVVERIAADKQFFNSAIDTVQQFFVYGILPEIVGKWYTQKPIANSEGQVLIPLCTSTDSTDEQQDTQSDESETFGATAMNQALVRRPSVTMASSIKWFHLDYLRIRCPPKGKQYCPSCCKLITMVMSVLYICFTKLSPAVCVQRLS